MNKTYILSQAILILTISCNDENNNIRSYLDALTKMNSDTTESETEFSEVNFVPVIVNPKLLKKFEGKYIAGLEQNMIITSDSNSLYSEVSGYGKAFKLIPISETLYQFENNEEKIIFIRDTNGIVDQLIYLESGYIPWIALKE